MTHQYLGALRQQSDKSETEMLKMNVKSKYVKHCKIHIYYLLPKSSRVKSIGNSIFSFEIGGDVGNPKNYKHIKPALGKLVKLADKRKIS